MKENITRHLRNFSLLIFFAVLACTVKLDASAMTQTSLQASFTFNQYNGTVTTPSSYQEDFLIVAYGRTLCGNTRAMLAKSEELRTKGYSVKSILMDIDSTADNLAAYAAQYPSIVVAHDSSYNNQLFSLLRQAGNTSSSITLPGLFVLNKSRTVIGYSTGYDPSGLESFIVAKAAESQTSTDTSSQVRLNQTNAKLVVGKTLKLKLVNAKGKITWKSGSTSIATVTSAGKVKAKKIGKVTITAACGGKKYKCTVTVIPAKQKVTSIKSPKSAQVTLKWKKDKNAKGYQIQYALDKSFKKSVKTANVTKNSTVQKTISKLKKGKTYYFRVRSYGTYKGKKIYGTYSAAVKIKVKK